MNIKNLILIIFLLVMTLSLKEWLTCHNFKDDYHFSVYSLKLRLDDAIHNDLNISHPIIRLYHNKATYFLLETISKYLSFLDITLIMNLLSPVGLLGIILGFWQGLKSNNLDFYVKTILFFLFLLPMMEIFLKPNLTFAVKIMAIALPFHLFSYYGISSLIKEKFNIKIYFFITVVIWVSLFWQLAMGHQVRNFCN